jgi:hypothetical protein
VLPFVNTAKAQVTQSLIKLLCEHAGYRVTRLGVEELLNEVKYLDRDQYAALELPEQNRSETTASRARWPAPK